MTTRELIEQITDSARFEALCTAVLRVKRPELEGLHHTGVNAEGKTIKNPVDGFTVIQNASGTKIVMVQHTTSRNLEDKWLNSTKGDVPKTIKQIEKWREKHSNADAEIILTSTHVPSQELVNNVLFTAKLAAVSISFLDQSSLADYLDDHPSGHWIRKRFFNVDYKLLSEHTLSELSIQDAQKYKTAGFIPDQLDLIDRSIGPQIVLGKINALIGNSGYGKTSACYHYWIDQLKKGKIVFWFDETSIGSSIEFEDCLRSKLASLKSNLQLSEDALWLNKDFWNETIFILDDLNRISDRRAILKRVMQWHETLQGKSWKVTFIVPLWEENSQFLNPGNGRVSIQISKYSLGECEQALFMPVLKLKPETDRFQLYHLAHDLNNDPLLVGLFKETLTPKTELKEASKNVIRLHIKECTQSLTEKHHFLEEETRMALHQLGEKILQHKTFTPSFSELSDWFKNQQQLFEIIKAFLKQGKLITLDSSSRLLFRHDRVEHEVVASVLASVQKYEDDWRFKEVFFYTYIAHALTLHKAEISHDTFAWFLKNNPLAVFDYIRLKPEELNDHNIKIIRQWIIDHLNINLSRALEERIKSILFFTDSERVLELISAYARYDFIATITGMKNGSTLDGVQIMFNHYEIRRDTYFDFTHRSLIKRVLTIYREKTIQDLTELLTREDLEENLLIGSLAYAAEINSERLVLAIEESWRKLKHKDKLARYVIMSYLGCGGNVKTSFWSQFIAFIPKLSNKAKESIEHELVRQRLKFKANISFIIQKMKLDDTWNAMFMSSVQEDDSPESLEYVMAYCIANHPVDVEYLIKHGYYEESRPYFDIINIWDVSNLRSRRLPVESIYYLFQEWSNKDNSTIARWFAFQIWEKYATKEDLSKLRAFDKKDDLFSSAFWMRVILQDMESVHEFEAQLPKAPYLMRIAYYIWCPEMKLITGRFLNSLPPGSNLYDQHLKDVLRISLMLTKIPLKDAEDLVVENWEKLKRYNEFILVALYLDSAELNSLATRVIEELNLNSQIFVGVDETFGSSFAGKGHALTVSKLERLKPYFSSIDESDLFGLIDPHNKTTFQWWRNNIAEISVTRRYFLKDEEIRNEFKFWTDETNNGFDITLRVEQLQTWGTDKESILRNLKIWLDAKPTIQLGEFYVASRTITALGQREDLKWLHGIIVKLPSTEERKRAQSEYDTVRDEIFLDTLD